MRPQSLRGTVRHFFSLVVSKCDYHPDKTAWAKPFAGQVSGFFEYLREERGLRPGSIHHYEHYLRRFERYLNQVDCRDLGAVALPVITGFITAYWSSVPGRWSVWPARCGFFFDMRTGKAFYPAISPS